MLAGSIIYAADTEAGTIAPADVGDLTVSSSTITTVTLSWIAPGDDGDIGTAAKYDLRFSTAPITAANWDMAGQATAEPVPQAFGSTETCTVSQLTPDTTYYFAVRTSDEVPNESGLSNVVNATTVALSNVVYLDDTITTPYMLSQADTTYILTSDITADGTAFKVKASDIILDLNGHTITYDDSPAGLPNYDFEFAGASDDIPADWDLSGAPTAKRSPTSEKVMVNKWYLKFENPTSDQTIVSPWIDLPQNRPAIAYFLRGERTYEYDINFMLEVEHETDGVIASFIDVYEDYAVPEFTTLNKAGKYRVKLTYFHPTYLTWQPDYDYSLKDIVVPTTSSGKYFKVVRDNGVSGSIEPDWPTAFAANDWVVDNELEWSCHNIWTDIHIDLVDLRPTRNYAVARYNRGGQAVIRNGSIIQGRGSGFRSPAVYNYSSDQLIVENLYIENWGLESEGIYSVYSDAINVRHCDVVNHNLFIFNRSQGSAPVKISQGSSSNVYNNTIVSGIGWGGYVLAAVITMFTIII
jgi:hypothetical protein